MSRWAILVRHALGAALLVLLSPCALAQTAADAKPAPPPDLYQEALEMLAEGRKGDASAALIKLIEREPLHAGGWLDLALIQCSLGNAEVAERLFNAFIERFAPIEGILEIVKNARATGCRSWKASHTASLTLGRGIDQNVNQGATSSSYAIVRDGVPLEELLSPEFRPMHDQYSVLGGDYIRDITPNGSIGFGQFQARRNDSLQRYDSASLYLGVETPWRMGNWSLRTTSMIGLTSLGGELYQRHIQLQARIAPPMRSGPWQASLIGGYSHVDYRTLVSFDSNTVELKAQLGYRKGPLSGYITTGYLNDHATGNRAGGNRHGWLTSILARRVFGDGVTGEVGLVRQNWDGQLPYAPGVINTVRDQLTHVLRATVIIPLSKNHNLQIEAREVRNKENISLFQYNNRLLQFNWIWNAL